VERIIGNPNQANTIDGSGSSASFIVNLSANSLQVTGVALTFTVENFRNVIGTSGVDYIVGSALNNVINGGNSDDTIIGSGGFDVITGGNGDDTVDYSSLSQAITIRPSGVINKGILGQDTVTVERIIGNPNQANTIDGSGSSASFIVNLSAKTLQVTGVPTTFTVENFRNVTGTSGNDSIFGSDLSNVINGGDGNDTINGAGGDNVMTGGNGDDVITGGNGNDTLTGGLGKDTLIGGSGSDVFVYTNFSDSVAASTTLVGTDVIQSLNFSEGDRIGLKQSQQPSMVFNAGTVFAFNPNLNLGFVASSVYADRNGNIPGFPILLAGQAVFFEYSGRRYLSVNANDGYPGFFTGADPSGPADLLIDITGANGAPSSTSSSSPLAVTDYFRVVV
jgi:Ca2+-binding RTX toxin-like protein